MHVSSEFKRSTGYDSRLLSKHERTHLEGRICEGHDGAEGQHCMKRDQAEACKNSHKLRSVEPKTPKPCFCDQADVMYRSIHLRFPIFIASIQRYDGVYRRLEFMPWLRRTDSQLRFHHGHYFCSRPSIDEDHEPKASESCLVEKVQVLQSCQYRGICGHGRLFFRAEGRETFDGIDSISCRMHRGVARR